MPRKSATTDSGQRICASPWPRPPTPARFTHYVDHIVVNPAWFTTGPCFGNSKHACLSPGHEDIALVWLKADATGITAAPIAEAGYLDSLNLTKQTFTVAGYGVDRFITGRVKVTVRFALLERPPKRPCRRRAVFDVEPPDAYAPRSARKAVGSCAHTCG
jgi:hypothetical protein